MELRLNAAGEGDGQKKTKKEMDPGPSGESWKEGRRRGYRLIRTIQVIRYETAYDMYDTIGQRYDPLKNRQPVI